MEELTNNERILATCNARDEQDAEEKMKEYAKTKKAIEQIKYGVKSGYDMPNSAISNAYTYFLSFCCIPEEYKKVQEEIAAFSPDMSNEEYLKKVEEIVGPLIENREINVEAYQNPSVRVGFEAYANERHTSVDNIIKRMLMKLDDKVIRTLNTYGVKQDVLEAARENAKKSRDNNSGKVSFKELATSAATTTKRSDVSSVKEDMARRGKEESKEETL